MARGKRNLSTQEKLSNINEEIESEEAKLKELKDEKKKLEEELKAEQFKEIQAIIEKNGLSIDEVKERLEK